MCELTFVHTQEVRRNRVIAYSQAFINGFKHKDGIGFSNGMMVWKTHLQAPNVTNLFSSMVKSIKSDLPIIVHTRFASFGMSNTKDVKDENSHPFQGKTHVFAHNGVLTPKVYLNAEQKKAIGDITDSEYFLRKLEESKETDLVTAINETMKGFTGKFAFLIYDDTTKKHYAIRGWSANLFWIPITAWVDGVDTPVGFVINTEKEDLVRGLVLAKNLCSQSAPFNFDSNKIVEFEKESAYELDGIVPVKVGAVKENFTTAAVGAATGVTYPPLGQTNTYQGGHGNTYNNKPFPGQKFIQFCLTNRISNIEADLLVLTLTGSCLAGLDATEIKWLDEVLVPELEKRVDKKKTDLWYNLLLLYPSRELYNMGVSFPYILEDYGTLKNMTQENNGKVLFKKGNRNHAKTKVH